MAALLLLQGVAALATAPATAAAETPRPAAGELTMETFLDRLMQAESGGRTHARSARSTALGPYQFIASTWLHVMRRNFAMETAPLRADQILALRTDRLLSRRAAKVYTEQNAAFLVARGHKATFPHLRLAFLVGPGAAVRILAARPETPASTLLGTTVIGANPFMARLSAAALIARCARELDVDVQTAAGLTPEPSLVLKARADGSLRAVANGSGLPARPHIAVRCDLSRPSCRRWLSLAERRLTRQRRASR